MAIASSPSVNIVPLMSSRRSVTGLLHHALAKEVVGSGVNHAPNPAVTYGQQGGSSGGSSGRAHGAGARGGSTGRELGVGARGAQAYPRGSAPRPPLTTPRAPGTATQSPTLSLRASLWPSVCARLRSFAMPAASVRSTLCSIHCVPAAPCSRCTAGSQSNHRQDAHPHACTRRGLAAIGATPPHSAEWP